LNPPTPETEKQVPEGVHTLRQKKNDLALFIKQKASVVSTRRTLLVSVAGQFESFNNSSDSVFFHGHQDCLTGPACHDI
jgi:hypothetical protein